MRQILRIGLVVSVILMASAAAQDRMTISGSKFKDAQGTNITGQLTFQPTANNGQPISYKIGGGGLDVSKPTSCAVNNGAIVGTCQVANTATTSPQNVCFRVSLKEATGRVVLGYDSTNPSQKTGFECVQPRPTATTWCNSTTCNLDNYSPNLVTLGLVQEVTSGAGVVAKTCSGTDKFSAVDSGGNFTCSTDTGGSSEATPSLTENTGDITSTKKIIAPSFEVSGTAPTLFQGIKQTTSPSIDSGYDFGIYVGSDNKMRCALASGLSCLSFTKTDVGLGNVDNTSDAGKPISTATQTALDAKQNSLGFTPENSANKGAANGYAPLGADGKVPAANLSSNPTKTGVTSTNILAEYLFEEGSGTTVTDTSGAGNNATFCATTQAPTWSAGGGITLTSIASSCVTLPVALNAAKTVMVVTESDFIRPQNYSTIMGGISGTSNVYMIHGNGVAATGFWRDAPTPGLLGQGGAVKTLMLASAIGTHIQTFVFDGFSNDNTYFDGAEVSQAQGKTTPQTGGNYMLGRSNLNGFDGKIKAVIAWSDRKTRATVLADEAKVIEYMRLRGTPITNGGPVVANLFVADGDSISVVNTPYTDSFNASSFDGANWTIKNIAVSGQQALQMLTRYPRATFNAIPANSDVGRVVVAEWVGTNDIAIAGRTGLQSATDYAALCRKIRATGAKVAAFTMLDRSSGAYNTERGNFNAYVRTYWRSFADALVDAAADPNIGANGASASTTYFSDQIHPTTTADTTIIAPMVQRVVGKLVGHQDATAATTYTGNATQANEDAFVILGTISAPATFTLQTCLGYTGQRITLKNINGSANAWTLAAASGETIDGASSITVANKATVVIEAILTSASAGGCSWYQVQ